MPRYHETNPHFDPPPNQDQPLRSPGHGATPPQHHDPPGSRVSRPQQHRDQRSRTAGPMVGGPWPRDQQNQPLSSSVSQPQHQDQQNQPLGTGQRQPQPQDQQNWEARQRQPQISPWFSIPWLSASNRPSSPRATEPQHHDQRSQPLTSPAQQQTKKPKRPDQRQVVGRASDPQAQQPKEGLPEQKDQVGQPPYQGQRRPQQAHEAFQRQHHGQHSRPAGLRVPSPRRTKLVTWFLAGFCAIFWIVIILGGLIVLIVYLLFRPHNPQFDVSGVTLNAAYLDMDVLLNADITVLANFTNPNRKVKVDFNYVVLDLYYGSTLIASQYVEPFSAARNEYKLQDVHLVTSQVRLPAGEIERLKKEVSTNAVVFKIKGVFHARSNLGSLLRYSYRLYGTCVVMVNGPPTGVIRGKRCKTKR